MSSDSKRCLGGREDSTSIGIHSTCTSRKTDPAIDDCIHTFDIERSSSISSIVKAGDRVGETKSGRGRSDRRVLKDAEKDVDIPVTVLLLTKQRTCSATS